MSENKDEQPKLNTPEKNPNIFYKIKGFFAKTFHNFGKIFFPSNIKCLVCGDDLKQVQDIEVCDKCMQKLEFITDDKCCNRCGAPVTGEAKFCLNCKSGDREFDLGRSVFVYKDDIARLIAGFKYKNRPYLHKTFGLFLAELLKELDWEIDFIMPIPLTPARLKWRGYNQTELLARVVSEKSGIPLDTTTLIKEKDTDSQATLNLQERRKNLRSSFKVTDKNTIKGKRILLIDDVMTTGSTANACANVLKKSSAERVFIITIAHGKVDLPLQSNLNNAEKVIKSVK